MAGYDLTQIWYCKAAGIPAQQAAIPSVSKTIPAPACDCLDPPHHSGCNIYRALQALHLRQFLPVHTNQMVWWWWPPLLGRLLAVQICLVFDSSVRRASVDSKLHSSSHVWWQKIITMNKCALYVGNKITKPKYSPLWEGGLLPWDTVPVFQDPGSPAGARDGLHCKCTLVLTISSQ